MSVVRNNLMTQRGYTPYCGNGNCRGLMPRSKFNGNQFECHSCGWESEFEPEFIAGYKSKWDDKSCTPESHKTK